MRLKADIDIELCVQEAQFFLNLYYGTLCHVLFKLLVLLFKLLVYNPSHCDLSLCLLRGDFFFHE